MDPETVQILGLATNVIMLGISIVAISVSCYDRKKSNMYAAGRGSTLGDSLAAPSPVPLQHFCPGFVHNDHHHNHRKNHKSHKQDNLEKRLANEFSTVPPLTGEDSVEITIDG